jgi:hypothetical protein
MTDVLNQLPDTDRFNYRINKSVALFILPFDTYLVEDREAAKCVFAALQKVVDAVLEGKELDGMSWRAEMPPERYEGYQSHVKKLKDIMDRFAADFVDDHEQPEGNAH